MSDGRQGAHWYSHWLKLSDIADMSKGPDLPTLCKVMKHHCGAQRKKIWAKLFLKVRLKKACIHLDCVTTAYLWNKELSEQSTRTQIAFVQLTWGSGIASVVEFGNRRVGGVFGQKFRHWPLAAFRSMKFKTAQVAVLSRPTCIKCPSTLLPPIFVSSVNNWQKSWSKSGRSLPLTRNRRGPITEPRRTPFGNEAYLKTTFPIHTWNVL